MRYHDDIAGIACTQKAETPCLRTCICVSFTGTRVGMKVEREKRVLGGEYPYTSLVGNCPKFFSGSHTMTLDLLDLAPGPTVIHRAELCELWNTT